jgi:two-component system NtrC family sensor kinase
MPVDIMRPAIVIFDFPRESELIARYNELGAFDFVAREEYRPATLDRTLRFSLAQWRSRHVLLQNREALLRSERLATIGSMASGIAHEYNNLNAIVLAGLERFQLQQGQLSLSSAEVLRKIISTVSQSRRISESLLNLGKISVDQTQLIDLKEFLQDSLGLLKMRRMPVPADILMELPDKPCPIRINSNELHQIITNLVQNAVHAVHKASEPKVLIKLVNKNDKAIITITDNGVGIPEDDMAKIFQPFFSRKGTHSSKELFPSTYEGTGLGLSICQALVERSGGYVSISSVLGQGTKVMVTFSLTNLAVEPVATESTPNSTRKVAPSMKKNRVVIVDDNVELASLFQEKVQDTG